MTRIGGDDHTDMMVTTSQISNRICNPIFDVIYQLKRQHGLVPVWKVGVHGHDHAVGDDGQDDAVLEQAAVDKPLNKASENKIITPNLDKSSIMKKPLFLIVG